MAITLNQHRHGVTQEIIATFMDGREPKMGLGAFFPTVTSRALEVGIEVQRSRQLVAADVQRCTDPNRNIFSRSTEKIFKPPFYSESFDFTACQAYDVTFGMGIAPVAGTKEMLVSSAANYIQQLKWKIQRAIALQHASVLQTGTVTMVNGDSIDYKRKAASMVVKSGGALWSATTTADPLADMATGMDFLRNVGLSAGSTVNAIMGTTAFTYFMANDKVLKQAAIFSQIRRVDIGLPQFDNVTGFVYQGRVAAGDYLVNIWTYNDVYQDASGNSVKYINDGNVILVPDDFIGKTVYAGIPFVFGDQFSGQYVAPTEAEFLVHDIIDQVKKSWDFIIESAPLVIPVSVDRIYTMQVV